MKDSEILEKYDELMTIKDNIHIGKLNPFEYLELGDILKSNKKNNYYSSYYKKHNRTVFDTFDMFSSITRLKWLVQMRIIYANTIKHIPHNILYVSPGYSKMLTNQFKYNGVNSSSSIYPELRCFITKLLVNNYQNINQYNYIIFDSHRNYKDSESYGDLDIHKIEYQQKYKCMNFSTPFVNNKIVNTINNDYLIKIDLLYCNNIIRKRDSIQNIKRKIIYIIYIGLQLLLKGGSLVIEIDMSLYKKDNKYLSDILNILNIYFDDVSYFINNLERGYMGGTLLVIANKFNNTGDIDIVGEYIKSKYKMDLSKHYKQYNKDILCSLGPVFNYLINMMKMLLEVSDYSKSLTITDKNKLYDILDNPRFKIAQDIVKKYKISPAIDVKYHSPLLSHIRENKPGNILIYGNIDKHINDTIRIGNEYNFNKQNIYNFDTILNMKIAFDFVYMNFNCKDNGKFILSYIMKILKPGGYILFKKECRFLKDFKQLKRGKAFSILGVKYLLYNLAPTEEIFDSYNDSPA
tara:strand:+ start:321 stop:1880 length:1560 start_codon:yes stop_codon:yes gene_type:complete